jgi:hypothetical protein
MSLDVTIRHSEAEVTATFRYDRGWTRKALHLAIHEWGQIAYNGRFAPD